MSDRGTTQGELLRGCGAVWVAQHVSSIGGQRRGALVQATARELATPFVES